MMEGIKNYLTSLIAVSILTSVIQALFREKEGEAVRSLVCGMLVIIVAITPLSKIELHDISKALSRFRMGEYSASAGISIQNHLIAADIIKEQAEAYIWDKATQLQFHPEAVCVTVTAESDYPYPVSTTIRGKYTQQQRIELTQWIEQNLAIAENLQEWIWE